MVSADEEESAGAAAGGSSSISGGVGGRGGPAAMWRLPAEGETRRRYLESVGYGVVRSGGGEGSGGSHGSGSHGGGSHGGGGGGSCTIAWEMAERYTSVGVRHYTPPVACTPLVIRHHFPSARVVIMLADPIARAHAQQTQWLHSRCFRDAREAMSARRGYKGRLAKGAAPGCERLDASAQLRLELNCVKSCRLRVDSSVESLQQCAATCGRALRSALSCKANCPYLSLITSHYALVLPLWLRSFPCDQLLLLDGAALFPNAEGAHHEGGGSTAAAARSGLTEMQRRRVRLRQQRQTTHREPPSPPPPPPPPPPPAMPATQLIQLLRFVGARPEFNGTASALLQLQQRYHLASPSFGTSANPIAPSLLAELEAYFKPFQAQLRKVVASHRQCFAERTSSADPRKPKESLPKEKKPGMKSHALARAG